jgi:hypothetical protein
MRVDLPEVRQEPGHGEVDVRQEVDLVEEHDVRRTEHVRIFQGFV